MKFKALCIASLVMLSGLAFAAPTTYTFTTGTGDAGIDNAVRDLLGTTATVSGHFTYDPQATLLGNSADLGFGDTSSIYLGTAPTLAFSGLSGSVSGFSFSDPFGTVSVANDQPASVDAPLDYIHIAADPFPKANSETTPSDYPRQLSTFEVGGYRLDNVRFFWLYGADGADDFLNSANLPGQLPSHEGILALDFVRVDDPHNQANEPYFSNSIFFQSLLVQPAAVPEPSQLLLGALGMSLVMLQIGRTRRS